MAFDLGRSLLLADAVTPEALARALLVSATRGVSLVRALLATHAIEPLRLERELERGDAPYMRHVAPITSLVHQLPPGLCERLLAVPVRRDPRTGTIDIAVVDARDTHAAEEIAHWLGAPVRVVRTSLASMDAALKRAGEKAQAPAAGGASMKPLAPPIWVPSSSHPTEPTMTPAYGTPVLPPEVGELAGDADIPIPLRPKSVAPVPILEIGPPAVERDAEPVVDLRRRKSSAPPVPPAEHAPETARGPFPTNAPAPPFADVAPTIEEMKRTTDRDGVLELLVSGVRTVARRVAVFAVKREGFVGWTCSPEFSDIAALRAVKMPAGAGNELGRTADAHEVRLARIPKDATHAPMLAPMSPPPAGEVALAAVRVDGKAVAIVMADAIGDATEATKRMHDLAAAAGDALARLIKGKRK